MSLTTPNPGRLEYRPDGVHVAGDWTLHHYTNLKDKVIEFGPVGSTVPVDFQALGVLDTAGASLLVNLLGWKRAARVAQWAPDLSAPRQALLETVALALSRPMQSGIAFPHPVMQFLAAVGRWAHRLWDQQIILLGYIGLTFTALASTFTHPQRWRMAALFTHIKQTGLDTVPIVALLTFMVGAVVAFLGATVLSDFGASIYTVNLVGFSFLREFGVMLAAILLAGRTASAYAAQIGSMQANEEVDAIRTLGLNPVELLVLPRIVAMMLTLPILAFIGMAGGILGGLAVCVAVVDISPLQFFTILQRDVPILDFWLGLGKAPLFGFVIAIVGCAEGFKVTGSAESVGEHTTSSVVQSIVLVILLDAVAAMFFMEMGW